MSLTDSDADGQRKPRVVVIDDSRTVLATTKLALERAGYMVLTATDPSLLDPDQVAVADAVVVDVNMEQVFGDDVVGYFREQWGIAAPIYLYSSLPIGELRARAEAAGADGAVCKADGVDALLAQLATALEGA